MLQFSSRNTLSKKLDIQRDCEICTCALHHCAKDEEKLNVGWSGEEKDENNDGNVNWLSLAFNI